LVGAPINAKGGSEVAKDELPTWIEKNGEAESARASVR
jgi:hypothetical protein